MSLDKAMLLMSQPANFRAFVLLVVHGAKIPVQSPHSPRGISSDATVVLNVWQNKDNLGVDPVL